MSETRDVVAEVALALCHAFVDVDGWQDDDPCAACSAHAEILAAAGLLADPVLTAEVERLRAQVAQVEALHQRSFLRIYEPWCRECGQSWPCPTTRALADPTEGGASE
jgi:hypothetical protein